MTMNGGDSVDRLYPIAALSQREVADLRMDPLCVDDVDIDDLLRDWHTKSAALRSQARPILAAKDSDIIPLTASPEVSVRIQRLISAYRAYLPTIYEVGMVPLSKLVSPQRHVDLDYARVSFDGIDRTLTDDEVANYCIGSPVRDAKIDASFLGYPNGRPGEFSYLYQFSSEDQNVRYIPPMPLKPFEDLDIASDGGTVRYDVKAITVLVGPGMPFVHVLKVPVGLDGPAGRQIYRLVVSNGVHRLFRLAQLGNTHAAALIQSVDIRDIPDPFVDAKRESLFGADALRITEMANEELGRVFKWKRSKRVIKLQVNVTQEVTFVP